MIPPILLRLRLRPSRVCRPFAAALLFAATLSAADTAPRRVGALGALTTLELQGNTTFSERAIKSGLEGTPELLLASHPAAPLDDYLSALQRALIRGYHNAGFADASVTVSATGNRPAIRATIAEGARYLRGEIVVDGAHDVPARDIIRTLSEPRPVPPDDRIERAMHRVLKHQREQAAAAGESSPASGTPAADATTTALSTLLEDAGEDPANALWLRSQPAPFREGFTGEVEAKVRALLAERGHPLASVTAKLDPNPTTREVRLAMQLNEGPRAVLGTFTLAGRPRDSAEEFLRLMGLASGRELTPSALTRAQLALWNSARYFAFHLTAKPRSPSHREIDLELTVEENPELPPLREPLPRAAAALVRFANWMTAQATHGEFALVGASADGVRYSVAMSPDKGVAFSTAAADRASLAGTLTTQGTRLLAVSAQRTAGLEFTGSLRQVDGFLWFTTHRDPEKTGRHLDLTMGASFSGLSTTKGDRALPAKIELIVSPAFACAALLRDTTPQFDGGTVILIGKDGQPTVRFREDTGELIEWRIELGDRAADQPPGDLRFRAGRGEFDRIAESIGSSWPARQNPHDAFSPVLFALPFVTRALGSIDPATAAPATLAKWRLGALLAECFLASPEVKGWFVESPDQATAEFTIPEPIDATAARPGGLAAVLASGYYKLAATFWSGDSWPAKLSRELFYLATDSTRYTATVMDELDRDPHLGPIGSLAAAQLLQSFDPKLAERFARRAIAHSTPEEFRRDWELLLEGNAAAGRLAQDVVRAIAALDERDLAEILSALPPAESAVVRRGLAALRAQPTLAPAQLLRPFLDEWWERHLRPLLPARLATLLPGIEPIGPAGYTARGEQRFQRGDLDAARADFDQAIALDAKFAAAYFSRSALHLRVRDFTAALRDCDEAIRLSPQVARGYINRAAAHLEMGQAALAAADSDRALALDPNDAGAYANRAAARLALRDWHGAIADGTRALQLDPRQINALVNRSSARLNLGELDAAAADLAAGLQLDPKNPDLLNGRGYLKLLQRDYPGAIADLDQAIALRPDFVLAYNNRGTARKALGDTFGAMDDFDRSLRLQNQARPAATPVPGSSLPLPTPVPAPASRPVSPAPAATPPKETTGSTGSPPTPSAAVTALLRTAAEQRNRRDLDGALASLDQAIRQDAQSAEAYRFRASIRLEKNDPNGALADANRALTLNPRLALAYYERGSAHRRLRRDADALADLAKALELDPDLAAAYFARAQLHESRRDWRAVISDCDAALARNAQQFAAYNTRGYARQQLGDHARALTDFSAAIQRSPRFFLAIFNRGVSLRATGKLPAALADLDQVIALSPNHAGAHTNRACVRAALGQYAAAAEDYQAAATRAPAAASLTTVFRWLNQRRLDPSSPSGDLAATVATWPEGWEKTVGRFLTGDMNEEAFLASAQATAGNLPRTRECESSYFAGMKHLFDGDLPGARQFFDRSVATGQALRFAHSLARAERDRLAARP